jgi:hypothetical protein
MTTFDVRKISEETSAGMLEVAADLAPSRSVRRRHLLGAAGMIAAGGAAATLLDARAAPAEAADVSSTLKEYFSILATGEALFVTFYSNAVANHRALGLAGAELNALKAILTEEQIHYNFAVANGGTPATTHFSFPHGQKTFENRSLFLQTQQLSEELTNGALLAWIQDMAKMGQPRLAQIGGQLMQVEGGHRVVGRVILNAEPWDNWAFGPVGPDSFLQVPDVVKAHGFLSPKPGNDFVYHPVRATFPGVIHKQP